MRAAEKQRAIEDPPQVGVGTRYKSDMERAQERERRSAHERLLTTEAGERTYEKHGTRHSHKFVESTTIDANRGSNKQFLINQHGGPSRYRYRLPRALQ
jgi:hypothetical protein